MYWQFPNNAGSSGTGQLPLLTLGRVGVGKNHRSLSGELQFLLSGLVNNNWGLQIEGLVSAAGRQSQAEHGTQDIISASQKKLVSFHEDGNIQNAVYRPTEALVPLPQTTHRGEDTARGLPFSNLKSAVQAQRHHLASLPTSKAPQAPSRHNMSA